MTTVLLIVVLVVFSLLTLNSLIIMANISTLVPRLQELQSKVNTISLNVQALKDQAAQSAEIPAEAEALLTNLNGTIDAAVANSQLPSPSPLP